MKIPFFNYPQLYLEAKKNYLNIFDSVSSNGGFIMQSELDNFERELSSYLNANFAIGVGNATDGLEIALMSLNLKPGDEVICSAHTMVATASAIKMAGGTPKIVDIGHDNLIDPEAISEAINTRTVGIMPTQLNGRTCDMGKIMDIAEKNKLFVVEDAAQALGSKFREKNAGTFGIASAISFYPAKILGCLGDGGIILTNSKNYYKKMKLLRDHGRDTKGKIIYWGYNSRLDNIQAGFLNYFFTKFTKTVKRRREIAKLYNNELSDLNDLRLPPIDTKKRINFDTFQNYEILAKNRDKLRKYLSNKGIGTIIQWNGVATNKLKKLGIYSNLKNSDMMFKQLLMLPMNNFLTNKEIIYITTVIKNFYKKK